MAEDRAFSGSVSNELQSIFNINMPQILNILIKKKRNWLPFASVCLSLGLFSPIMGETAGHFESGVDNPNFHVRTTVGSPGAGNPLVFNVADYDVSAESTVYPRKWNTLRFKGGLGTGGLITDKTFTGGHWQITVTPLNPAVSLPGVAADEAVWITGDAYTDGSGQGEAANTYKEEIFYPIQHMKEKYELTGWALTNQPWTQKDELGNPTSTIEEGQMEAEFRQWVKIGWGLLFSEPNVNSALPGQPTMYGMDYAISTAGNVQPYTTGVYGIPEFEDLDRVLTLNYAGYDILTVFGPQWGRIMTSGLTDLFLGGGGNYLAGSGTNPMYDKFVYGKEALAKEQGVSMSFRYLNYINRTFHFCPLDQLGYANTGGAPGFRESEYAFHIPLGKTKDAAGKSIDRFQVRYKNRGRFNRMMQTFYLGANAPTPTDENDNLSYNIISDIAAEYFGIDQFVINKPA